MPDPTTPAGTETPASGGTTPETTTTPPATETGETPFFVAKTKEEYEANYGAVREKGRLSLAKKYGYDTIEAFDTAMSDYKKRLDGEKTELENATTQATTAQQQAEKLAAENRALKLERAAEKAALEADANPKRVDAILRLRAASDADFDAEGNPSAQAIKSSIEAVLADYPEFKKAGKKIGSGTPAAAASEKTSLDEQITQAQKDGNHAQMIALQMQKLFSAN
jgi:uncharacterized protein involved in type VI secretion and phage assembly